MSPLAEEATAGIPIPSARGCSAAVLPALSPTSSSCRGPATPALAQLFEHVAQALERERRLGFRIGLRQPAESVARVEATIRASLASYLAAGHTDWRALAHFSSEHYVRHLIDDDENFEMMLICWKRGQASRVHNHGSSNCWLSVLSGGVEELRFTTGDTPVEAEPTLAPRLPGVLTATTPCPRLASAGITKVGVGATAHINDATGLHAVRCDGDACGEGEEGAVSLHIYAPPIRRVRLYEPELNRVVVRAPGFKTVRGVEEERLAMESLMSASL